MPISGAESTGRGFRATRVLHAYYRNTVIHPLSPQIPKSHLSKGRGPRVSVELLARRGSAVGQRELEVLGEELLDVRAADAVGVVDLDDLEDLHGVRNFVV